MTRNPTTSRLSAKMIPPYLLVLVSVFAVFSTGCDSWPPQQRKLTRLYTENRSHLQELVRTMSSAGLVAVSHGANATAVHSSSDGQEYQTENNTVEGKELRKLLDESNIWAVYNDDGVFLFEPYVSAEDRNFWYRIRIVFDPTETRLATCSKIENRGGGDGTCRVPLEDEHWSIRYTWFPHGVDRRPPAFE